MNYYRRFMGDYNSKTAALSLAEHGAYNVLLDTCYSTEKPLPASVDSLCRICRAMSRVEQDAVKSVADLFFPVGGDGLRHNRRADDEIAKAQVTIAKQRESGVESAAKRWSTDGLTHKSTDGLAIQPSASNLQPLTSKPETPQKQARVPRGSRLDSEWLLPKAWGKWAIEKQPTWTAEHCREVGEVFKRHWLSVSGSKGVKLDWYMTWQNWVVREGAMKVGGKLIALPATSKPCAGCGHPLTGGSTHMAIGDVCNSCYADYLGGKWTGASARDDARASA